MPEDEWVATELDGLVCEERATIDDKRRLLLSRRLRSMLGSSVAVTMKCEGCIAIYTRSAWEEIVRQTRAADSLSPATGIFRRLFFIGAEAGVKIDSTGRLVIPYRLKERAKIGNKVLIVGAIDSVEVWDEDEYMAFMADPMGYRREWFEMIASSRIGMMKSAEKGV